jgi:MFS family permease
MYVGTSVVFVLLAVPAGRLADRFGRQRMLLLGHAILAATYALMLTADFNTSTMLAVLLLFGAYYAAVDGVLVALAAPCIPSSTRGTGLALLTTITSLGRLLGSIAFGGLWAWGGPDFAVAVFGAVLLAGIGLGLWWLSGKRCVEAGR